MQILHNNICIVKLEDYLSGAYDSLVAGYQYVFAENEDGRIYPVATRYEKCPISVLISNGFFGANVQGEPRREDPSQKSSGETASAPPSCCGREAIAESRAILK